MQGAVSSTPPESLVKYSAPLFNGITQDTNQAKGTVENTSKLDEMIYAMIPAREWVEESGIWSQKVSMEPASRMDVITLQEKLDAKLSERKAREAGICPVREELYSQAFDELIRQVALDGPERGLIMMRVRDEMRMTIDAYKTLFASSVAFGVKKQLQAEKGLPELQAEAEAMREEVKKMDLEVTELKAQIEIADRREAERKAADDKRRKEEQDFLKYQGQHLDSFLKQISSK
jgi:dynein light intermediate chain